VLIEAVWDIKFLLQQLSELCSFYPKVPNLSLQMKGYGYISVNLNTKTQDGHICIALLIKLYFLCFSHRNYWIYKTGQHAEKIQELVKTYKYLSVYKANKQCGLRITYAMAICTFMWHLGNTSSLHYLKCIP
jgi:hypothetical protein